MTDTERDKINQTIHEARGLCWHKTNPCLKCGHVDYMPPSIKPDYTSDWSAWGAALEWAQKEEWWEKFAYQVVRGQRLSSYSYEGHTIFNIDLLNPELGSAALAKFIDKHPKYFTKEVGR